MPRRSVWKVLSAIALALALGVGAFFAWVRTAAERRWEALKSRIPALAAEAKARDPRRPPLGEGVPGNAWDEYGREWKELRPSDAELLQHLVFRGRAEDRDKALDQLALHDGALERVAAGARRTEGAFPRGSGRSPDFAQVRALTHLAILHARFRSPKGELAAVRERLLAGVQMGADLGRDSSLGGYLASMRILELLFRELRDVPPDPEIAPVLARLDGAWPDVADALLNTALDGVAALLREDEEFTQLPRWNVWRYGFSTRLMLADAGEAYLEIMRAAAEVSKLPWRDPRRDAFAPLDAESRNPRNPVLGYLLMSSQNPARQSRFRLAELRLLRRYHGETAELEDPFGGPLKDWSVGPNGADDGGRKDDIRLK